MRRRVLAAVLALVGTAATGCGSSAPPPSGDASPDSDAAESAESRDGSPDSDASDAASLSPVTLEEFPAAFASRYCQRVYDCCLPDDRAAAAPGTDVASCTAEMTANARNNGSILLGFTGVGYFADAAGRCLDVLERGACGAVFEAGSAGLIACQDVFAGTEPLGSTCEDGRQCTSDACAGSVCAVAAVCSAAQVVNDTNGCSPRVGLGAPCAFSRQCPAGAACVASVCKQRDAIGAACSTADDCVGACATDTGFGVCRAPYCAGR